MFTVSDFDGGLFMWIGDNTFSNKYTGDNANIVAIYGIQPVRYQKELQAGIYYPFGILFANGQGDAEFKFSITSPNARVIYNEYDSLST